MSLNKTKNLIDAIKLFGEQKQISKDELHGYLIDVFKKAFEKVGNNEINEIELHPARIEVELDLDSGDLSIKRVWEVVEELEDINMNIHLLTDDFKVLEKY